MSSIHELLKKVYPIKLRMELFNAIWIGWRADIKEKEQRITDLQKQLANKDQDKISFTVEQLEKVKKEFNARKLEYITMETKTHIYGLRIDRINELINNQINELKGNVKNEN